MFYVSIGTIKTTWIKLFGSKRKRLATLYCYDCFKFRLLVRLLLTCVIVTHCHRVDIAGLESFSLNSLANK